MRVSANQGNGYARCIINTGSVVYGDNPRVIGRAKPKRPRGFLRGFTLIELLVVIAIIALLVSILLPSLNKAKELAKSAVCMSHQRSLSMACMMYYQDSDVMPVNGVWNSDGTVSMAFFGVESWSYGDASADLAVLLSYYEAGDMAVCPDWENDEFLVDSDSRYQDSGKYISYAFNMRTQYHFTSFNPSGLGTWAALGIDDMDPVPPEGFKNPGETLHFMDSASGYVQPWVAPPYWALIYNPYPAAPFANNSWETLHPSQRHMGNFNAAFMDGHVEHCEFDEYYDLEPADDSKSKPYWGLYN